MGFAFCRARLSRPSHSWAASICAAFCVVALVSGGAAGAANEDEPNDTASSADQTTVDGTVMVGSIGAVGDQDWFWFAAPSGAEYIAQTADRTGAVTDTRLELYDQTDLSLLASDDNSGNDTFSQLTWTSAGPNVFYIKVSGVGAATGPYTLRIWPNAADAREPDDTMAQGAGKPINIDASAQDHTLNSRADKDWMYFTPTAGHRYVLQTSSTADLGDTDTLLEVFDSAGSKLAENDNIGGPTSSFYSRLEWVAPATEIHYVCVSVPEPTAEHPIGPYSISLTEVPLHGTTLTAGDVTGYVGQTVQLSATLTSGGTGVAGATILFSLGAWSATDTTDGNGLAKVDYVVTMLGTNSYAARFEADGTYASAQGIGNVTGLRNPTTLVAGDVTGDYGKTVKLTATLTSRGSGVAGKTIIFDDGSWIGTAVTDASGTASVDYQITGHGSYNYTARFETDSDHEGSSDDATVTATNCATELQAADTSGTVGSTATLRATLTALSYPIEGKTVTFTVGTWTATATTDADGLARVDYAISAAGTQTYTASFAGDAEYLASSDSGEVTGTRSPQIQIDDMTAAQGSTINLQATLTSEGAPLAGMSVWFFDTFTAPFAAALTDAAGVATVPYTVNGTGSQWIGVVFTGSGAYGSCFDTATITITSSGRVTAIDLTLSDNPVAAGDPATATVTDQSGNDITDDCDISIEYGAGGSWSDHDYTSANAGTWAVTATYGGLTDAEELEVTHGAASSVDISPDAATITTAGTQAYTVLATDACGNRWTPEAADITWSDDGAGSFTGNTYTPDAADAGEVIDIYATVGGLDSDRAALSVYGTDGPGLILAWDKDDQRFYLCGNPADPASAGAAGLIPAANGTHTVNGVGVTVSGGAGNKAVAVNSTTGPSNSLRVRWYTRGGSVYLAYVYSTIAGVGKTATYQNSKTYVDGLYKTGFWGLAHALDAADPTTIAYGAAQQP